MRETLLALAARVEAGSGPDRALDLAICRVAMNGQPLGHAAGLPDETLIALSLWAQTWPYYTTSLDAAATLVPAGRDMGLSVVNGRCVATVEHHKPWSWAPLKARNLEPARALTAAALRARAAEADDGE